MCVSCSPSSTIFQHPSPFATFACRIHFVLVQTFKRQCAPPLSPGPTAVHRVSETTTTGNSIRWDGKHCFEKGDNPLIPIGYLFFKGHPSFGFVIFFWASSFHIAVHIGSNFHFMTKWKLPIFLHLISTFLISSGRPAVTLACLCLLSLPNLLTEHFYFHTLSYVCLSHTTSASSRNPHSIYDHSRCTATQSSN